MTTTDTPGAVFFDLAGFRVWLSKGHSDDRLVLELPDHPAVMLDPTTAAEIGRALVTWAADHGADSPELSVHNDIARSVADLSRGQLHMVEAMHAMSEAVAYRLETVERLIVEAAR